MKSLRWLPLIVLLAACNKDKAPQAAEPGKPATASSVVQPVLASAKPGAAAPGSTVPGAAAPAGAAPHGAAPAEDMGIEWTAPESWKLGPARPMRKATYAVPAVGSDAAAGELAVFYFGQGQGGDVEANIKRWVSQFKDFPAGSEKRNEQIQNDLKQTIVEIESGTYTNTMMAGPHGAAAAPPENKDYALLGAVVEAPTGKYFFKFTGPKATVKANREAFFALLSSVKAKIN